ncbi:MAG: TlpA family protein disulfide reductase [Bacteroidetes bacterium]|nr:TlpA family protein disulfide reductase [Bacteroidota bacterium]
MGKTIIILSGVVIIILSYSSLSAQHKSKHIDQPLYQISISGTVDFCSKLDYTKTLVMFKARAKDTTLSQVNIRKDGSFNLTIECERGLYELDASHPNCVPIRIPLYVDSNFTTDVTLKLNYYSTKDTTVYFHYSSNQFPLNQTAIPVRGNDNIWRAKVKAQSPELFYQVKGDEITGRTHCPSRYDRIIPDPEGDMIGVISTKNSDSVLLEYKWISLPPCNIENPVKFSNQTLENRKRVYDTLLSMMAEMRKFRNENLIPQWIESSYKTMEFSDSAMATEHDGYITALLLKSYSDAAVIGWYTKQPKYKPQIIEQVNSHCQKYPDVWTIDMALSFAVIGAIYENQDDINKHLGAILECKTISNDAKSLILSGLDEVCTYKKQISLAEYYKSILLTNYQGTSGYDAVVERLKELESDSNFVGKKMMSIPTLDVNGSKHIISSNDYKGKYILLDFWATWCKPCIEEMTNLLKVNSIYDTNRLQIVGISRDTELSKLKLFLQKKKLTWQNFMIAQNSLESVIKFYSAEAIPRIVLISPQGKVVAAGSKLRGEQLEETLKAIIR